MTTLQNGDSFLVQRTDSQSGISTNYQVSQENLMANLADDDLLLVQRTSAGISTNYSITGSALKEDLTGVTGLIVPPVEVLTPINGAGITEFDQYEPLSSAITAVSGGGTFDRTTDEIQSVTDISNWNQSQTWSSGTYTGSQPPSSSYAVEYAFNENGEDGGSFGPGDYWAIESGEATLTFSSPITLSSNSTVEILAGNYEWIAANGGGMTFICSNGSVPVTLNAVNNAVAKTTISDAYTTFGSQITAITLTAASNGWMSLVGLFVDGKRLVDAGIAGATITGKLLSFPTNTNFGEFQVNQRISDYTTFNPDSGDQNGGVLSDDNLTISAENTQYIERRSKQTAFNDETTYIEFTVSGSGLRGGIGVGDSDALVISEEGSFVVYRQNGDVIKYPGNMHVFTLQPWSDGDVIGVRLTNYNNNPTLGFSKNGQSMGSVGMSQYSFTTDLFVHAGLFPTGSASITANFGSSPFVHTPAQGFDGLNPDVIIQDIDASATPPTITVSGGTWDDSNKSQFWSGNVSGNLFEPAYPMSKAFNGVLTFNNNAFAEMNNTATLTFPGAPISFTTLRVYAQKYAVSSTATFFVNGNDYTSQLGGSGNTSLGWYTITGETELTSIGLGSYNGASDATGLYAVEVDGKILVDGFEDSQVWSNGTYTGTSPNNNYGVEDLFANAGKEGDAFGANKLWGLHQATGSFALDNPIPLTSTSTLELITYQSNQGSTGTLTLTGPGGSVQAPLAINDVNVLGKTTIVNPYASLGDSITSITIAASGNDWTALESIYVDGKPVIDAGIRDLGETRISTDVSYEKSLTFSDTTELANMVAPLEMADATGSNSLTPTTSNVVSTSFTPSASYFNATTYTGDGSTSVQTFNTGLDMQNNGGMIWFKSRTSGQGARILDTYRGTLSSLIPSSTTSGSNLGADGLTFLNNGFSIGWEGSDIAGANDYVAWSFSEAAGFFDIVTWTGNGSSTREISHNLGSRPGFIIVKKTSGGSNRDWWCWHKSISTGDLSSNPLLRLNSRNGITNPPDNSPLIGTASSTMFEIAGDDNVNGSGNTYIAYVFADNPSKKIKCSSYTGTGSPGNVIDLGFEPKFFMVKRTDSDVNGNWIIVDTARGMPASGDASYLMANEPDSEFGRNIQINLTSTGVVINESGQQNESNGNYVYMAIGEAGNPDTTELTFQDNTALSALTSGMTITSDRIPTLGSAFSTYLYVGNTDPSLTITNGIDLAGEGGLVWIKQRNGQREHHLFDTERGATKYLNTRNSAQEQTNAETLTSFTSSGFTLGDDTQVNHPEDFVSWTFRNAPGFFDVVTYTGNGGSTGGAGDDGSNSRDVPHNLGTTPGMIVVKCLDNNGSWFVWHKDYQNTTTDWMSLNATGGVNSHSNMWGAINASSFGVTNRQDLNNTGLNYVAYVFADNPSNQIKCGKTSYLPGATTENVVCGFKPAFVMTKCISETGQWVMVDVERGLPQSPSAASYLYPNKNEQEGSSYDTMNMNANEDGFILKATNGAGEYIYIAIGSPTGMSSIPTGTLVADADPSTNTASVAATSWPTGDTVTGPSLSASLTSILEVSGNTIFGNGSTGTWIPGYYAEGSQVNDAPPGPSEITFTSQNQGTPAFSGVDATLASRTWTLESGASATGPWTLVDTYSDFGVLNTQTGATPWTENKPTLQPNTYYRIKVQYNSNNAESVESVYNTFKTGDA